MLPRDSKLEARKAIPKAPAGASLGEARDLTSIEVSSEPQMSQVAILTGGGDKPYALGLGAALVSENIPFDFIGSDEVNASDLPKSALVHFFNLRGDQRTDAPLLRKFMRVLAYYLRLVLYAAKAKPRVFHILWHNKFEVLDRTLLLLYYRLLGKRLVFTAHNVNAGERDGTDSMLNRLTLRIQYGLVDQVFVHTERMKHELQDRFGVEDRKVTVIPFGINSTVPNTALACSEARQRLGIPPDAKTILFFGNIAPYKGLEYLLDAMVLLVASRPDYRLIIVGRPKNCAAYWQDIQSRIARTKLRPFLVERIEFVPDEETEVFFKSADVLVLPYTHIFQSGVLFLGYNFGLPVIASDVGALKDDIVEGKTGYVCRPRDPKDLARVLDQYFAGDLYASLTKRRPEIQAYAKERYSWATVGRITKQVYADQVARN
jgi:D-inositol-3-phosphate glycosyltransferase